MDLTFERGDRATARGHALVYFRNSRDESEVFASYVVVPPVPLNLARYIPPMFAANVPASEMQNTTAIPIPPMPEKVESSAYLQRLAEARDEDLIFAGGLDPQNTQQALAAMSEVARQYLQLYSSHVEHLPAPPAEPAAPEEAALAASDILYSLLSEKQRLAELAKLTGKLRWAVDGGDSRLVKETVEEMRLLGRHLAEKYRVGDLITAAQVPGPRGARLSQLYIDRGYRLSEEDYASLRGLEEEIRSLQS